MPPPFRYLLPTSLLPVLSAAKVNGDERAHQRLDVVAAEQWKREKKGGGGGEGKTDMCSGGYSGEG